MSKDRRYHEQRRKKSGAKSEDIMSKDGRYHAQRLKILRLWENLRPVIHG